MFCTHPLNPVRRETCNGEIFEGYPALVEQIQKLINPSQGTPVITVDGTHGANFALVVKEIKRFFSSEERTAGAEVVLIQTDSFLKPEKELHEVFDKNITENRAFGYVSESGLSEYFLADARNRVREQLLHVTEANQTGSHPIIVVVGVGAHWLVDEADVRVFLDVSREYQQVMYKRGLQNFGFSGITDNVVKYKIAYFVEWPALESYRKQILTDIDLYIDMNKDLPTFVSSNVLFEMVSDISRYPMRVKPFFAEGVWGGQYLKELAQLPKDMVNCAWSFEPIAPENTILVEHRGHVIEVPFLIVMGLEHERILGERIVPLFGDYFPIRFDYLDTIDGDNLSCQVHPTQRYIRKHFNERLEQQESYYIMECKEDSKVYLGLTESCEKDEFIGAVLESQQSGEPIEFTRYVQGWDSKKGDLFLIPTGTVHCAGKDNLVLEISATTWWFTFKVYDYVRKDLDGKPRPINIDHAVQNIDFERRTNWVKEQLIQEPQLLSKAGGNAEYRLGGRKDLLFYVNRIHLIDEWSDSTDGEFVMFNLVEGERVRIVSRDNPSVFVELSYAESYIVPAVFGAFTIVNLGKTHCKLIKAGVSPEWEVKITDEQIHDCV